MEKLAYLAIGASVAVVVMTVLPMTRAAAPLAPVSATPVSVSPEAAAPASVSEAPDMADLHAQMNMAENSSTESSSAESSSTGNAHQHPALEVSAQAPTPNVTHLVFPDVMGGYNVQILSSNFTFTPAAINRPPEDNEGHAHIYVNGAKVARVYSNWFHLSDSLLNAGENEVRVTLNANNHSEWAVNGVPISSVVQVFKPDLSALRAQLADEAQ